MRNPKSVCRDDSQLLDILDEIGTWVIHGRNSEILGAAATLRRAIGRADDRVRERAFVVAVSRAPPNRIFVFYDQVERLYGLMQDVEVNPGTAAR
jgi:hypothetical protein